MITTRDLFAAIAMHALIVERASDRLKSDNDMVVRQARRIADDMMTQMHPPTPPKSNA